MSNENQKKCLGTKPLCENGYAAVCNTEKGEWECRGIIAIDKNVEQSDEVLDGSKERNGND